MSENAINQRITDFLYREKISQTALAKLLNMTPAGVGQMLKSKNDPGINHLLKISEAYGIDINYLLKGEGKEQVPQTGGGNVNTNKNRLSVGGPQEGGSSEALFLRRENERMEKEIEDLKRQVAEWKEMYNKVLEKLLGK